MDESAVKMIDELGIGLASDLDRLFVEGGLERVVGVARDWLPRFKPEEGWRLLITSRVHEIQGGKDRIGRASIVAQIALAEIRVGNERPREFMLGVYKIKSASPCSRCNGMGCDPDGFGKIEPSVPSFWTAMNSSLASALSASVRDGELKTVFGAVPKTIHRVSPEWEGTFEIAFRSEYFCPVSAGVGGLRQMTFLDRLGFPIPEGSTRVYLGREPLMVAGTPCQTCHGSGLS